MLEYFIIPILLVWVILFIGVGLCFTPFYIILRLIEFIIRKIRK